LVNASDMAGFSRQEQLFLSILVACQRRDIDPDFADSLPKRLRKPIRHTLLCMRLAWIFCRTREDKAIPAIEISLSDSAINLVLPAEWMENHPLSVADLDDETRILKSIDLHMEISYERN
jgi:exopolyphosphatase/guanosine-5'-triphosphate,3'-diphosphate pyrophosphatase